MQNEYNSRTNSKLNHKVQFEENGEPKDFQFGDLYNVNSTDLVKAFLTYNGIEAE